MGLRGTFLQLSLSLFLLRDIRGENALCGGCCDIRFALQAEASGRGLVRGIFIFSLKVL